MPRRDDLSLGELASGLLDDVVKSDAEMQVRSRFYWEELKKQSPLAMQGGNGNPLRIESFTLELHLRPIRRNWLFRLLGIGKDAINPVYRLLPDSQKKRSTLRLQIVVQRDELGRYKPSFHPQPEDTDIQPDRNYVRGIAR